MKKGKLAYTIFLYFLMGCFILLFLSMYQKYTLNFNENNLKYTYSTLINDIENGNIKDIKTLIIKPDDLNSGYVKIIFEDKRKPSQTLAVPSISNFMEIVHKNLKDTNIVETKPISKRGSILSIIMPIIFTVVTIIVITLILKTQEKGPASRVNSFGKSKAKMLNGNMPKVTFKDVAGLREEKGDLEEVVEFLKEPQKFEEIGARIPKGILLVGPPGTGKTLLARAIAGEADVKFFSISGSDFVEMFVGVGASRVRSLFEEAKNNKPCLIFIDEIDAVGRKRGSGLGGGHDEREQTLNQLLVEMDGFTKNEGIIIIAATNRPDILDPALLRPGRFDRQIFVGSPDVKGREDILKVHAKNKKIDENVEISEIAKMTSGFTGAELENLLNESAILAAKSNCKFINMEHIKKAFIKVGVGTERKSRVISQEEKEITAYHEAGHAILFEMLNLLDSVHIVSIIPTGSAGGYTMPLPVDKGYLSKNYLRQHIISLFGGRVAEDIIFSDVTTGASNDIERATKTAYSMVSDYGMSSLGPMQFNPKINSEQLASLIDKEVEKIISEAYETAKKIINENIEVLHSCASLLMEKEKISGDEFRKLFPENYLPEKKKPTLIEFNSEQDLKKEEEINFEETQETQETQENTNLTDK